ncbi:hypothetical protein EMA8858_03667 [Emticicia aquatica]|jgi:hypothetical protein|uniref:DUF4595 domain-containing protein n=1 Tax=Emticicia aquatica TaxID=1681835 RepID=A0ABN8F2Q5_9BACT|nr:hypothetical protein [Emticicia aquatica]CAH0997533.1 hypothetical protein EMA8858_03667 [Emticicia aquatica]
MYFLKPIHILLLLFLGIFISCNTNEIKLLKEQEANNLKKQCFLNQADHGHGVVYNFGYNAKNQLISMDGFPDFDELIYENDLPRKATSSFDNSYYIAYDYNTKGALNLINFVGKDSRDRPFEFKSKVYTNDKKQIEKIDLSLPVFDEIIVTKLEYDANGNLKKIILVENNKDKTILENIGFDNKKSPYINTPFSNVMAYFTVFSAMIGSENTTYFGNKNNATSTKIYTDGGEILFTYSYEYDSEDFPSKVKVSKKAKSKEEIYEERFTYNCK